MGRKKRELDLEKLRTLSIGERKSKISLAEFGKEVRAGMTVSELVDAFPDVLAGRDWRRFIDSVEKAIRAGREWIVMLGGHVVKTGSAPFITPMIERGWLSTLAMNGSASIHDVEVALFGRTSEIVEESLEDGSFGMARETAEFVNGAAVRAHEEERGLGETLGASLLESDAPHAERSLLACAVRADIPVTVHVALGTDVVHQHPSAVGAAIGDATLRDFRIFAASVAELSEGVVSNWGSAVLMPEVFLKALTVARNIGNSVQEFTAVDFDMIRHYRPLTNVVRRPTQGRGWGTHFTGHHEILIPLLAACLQDRLSELPPGKSPRR